jgi:hypothetical protein
MKAPMTILLSAVMGFALAQPTLIADYPFTADGFDLISSAEATLQNALFAEGGVYSNGIYPGNDPSGTSVITAEIESLDFEHFSFTLEFRAASLPTELSWMPIVSGGPLWRWLTVLITREGQIGLRVNNGSIQEISDRTVEVDVWHDLTVKYDGDTVAVLLNDTAVIQMSVPDLDTGDNKRISNIDWGAGRAFKGYWRNLKVYNGDATVSLPEIRYQPSIKVFPNPASGMAQVLGLDEGDNHVLRLYSADGRFVKSFAGQASPAYIDLSGIPSGMYVLQVHGAKRVQSVRLVVK